MNRRRTLLLAFAAWYAGATRAQPQKPAPRSVRIGILLTGSPGTSPDATSRHRFVTAMRELGWVEGRNVTYDRVYAEGDETRLPELGGQLVARKADLLYVTTNPEALAVQGKTRTIPIVFSAVAGPVEIGLVKSLARPGGNATGVANIGWELGGKRMQLLKQVLPNLRRVGVLVVPNTPSAMNEPQLIGQAAGTGVEVMAAYVKDGELGTAFASLAQRQVEAVLMTHSVIFMRQRKRVLELASKLRIPVIGHRSEIAEAGALLSYSSILLEQVRASARIADKILKGARPADIPVERPVKFELVVNLKTANALGITVPQSVLLQADRVIE